MSVQVDEDSIKVYCNVNGLTAQTIYELLRSDAAGTIAEVKEQFAVIVLPEQRPLQIFQYQDTHYKKPDYDEQSYFLIVDSPDPVADGVLLCNLTGDHGFPDAVREEPAMAGMAAGSLGIANSNWCEMREGAWCEDEPLVRRLAVYDNRASTQGQSSRLRMVEAVDYGLHYAYKNVEDLDDPDEPPPLKKSVDDLFRYTAIELDGHQSTDELCEQHQQLAEENGLFQNAFAVIDDRFDEEGVLLIQTNPRKELRCKPPVAGELLWWHAVGLMNWAEMEAFAAKHTMPDYRWTVDVMTKLENSSSASETPVTSTLQPQDSREGISTEEQAQASEGRRFRYYRTSSGMVIASMEPHEVPSTVMRPRQESDGVDENGDRGAIEDTFVEELPWDYYLKKDSSEKK